MSEQEISFYPGTYDPSYTGIVRWQNGQLQLNRMVKVYNGYSNSTLHKGLDDELGETSPDNLLNETHTNGMQFKPVVYN